MPPPCDPVPRRVLEHSRRLTFAPRAWLKLLFFCHAGPTEVGGFGLSAADDLLYVEDFVTVPQKATPVHVRFEDEGLAHYFDACVDQGLPLQSCGRIWCHTHPGSSATPTSLDEDTFARCFGGCDWALMFILSRSGTTTARLACNVGPGAVQDLTTAVDWAAWPRFLDQEGAALGAIQEEWRREYAAHVRVAPPDPESFGSPPSGEPAADLTWDEFYPWSPELDVFHYQILEDPLE